MKNTLRDGDDPVVRLTVLNDIVHSDFERSLDIQKSWGIELVDLRSKIYGKSFLELTDEEAARAVRALETRGMKVYCLSSGLFFDDIEKGEAYFREKHLGAVAALIEAARRFRPSVVRLLSATFGLRKRVADSMKHMEEHHPWVIPLYREAIDRIAGAGYKVTIENEVKDNILTTPEEIVGFFTRLDRPNQTTFTFDVQNLWLMGTFPSLEVYRTLAPWIGYYHLKGGMADETGTRLRWKSSLADASWPVLDITRAVVRDGRCEAICLNPSHGDDLEGYDYEQLDRRNAEFLKSSIPEIV